MKQCEERCAAAVARVQCPCSDGQNDNPARYFRMPLIRLCSAQKVTTLSAMLIPALRAFSRTFLLISLLVCQHGWISTAHAQVLPYDAPVAADSYVDETAPTLNFGSSTNLIFGRDNNGFDRYTYIKFDLADQVGVDVVPAELRLYCHSVSGSTPFEVAGQEVMESWGELSINDDNCPSTIGGADIEVDQLIGAEQDFVVFSDDVFGPNTLAAVVKKWIDTPLLNNGIRLETDSGDSGKTQRATAKNMGFQHKGRV